MKHVDPSSAGGRHSSHAAARGAWAAPKFLAAWLRREAVTLDPTCFALVMATGIISNALLLHGHPLPSDALLAVNLVTYPWLCALTAWRAVDARAALGADLLSPHKVFAFFTFVAASDVLGVALALRGFATLSLILWLVAAAAWLALIYLGFGVLLLRNDAEGADVADGAWLNGIVGTQSLVILAVHAVWPVLADPLVLLLTYALWTVGLGLYGVYVVLFCRRAFFRDLTPADVGPLLWIVMGAAAISANAGATLATNDSGLAFLQSIRPLVSGVTLALWAWGTWWIPLLLLLGIWKHGVRRVPIDYRPVLWSIVFPLGMYAVATLRLSRLAEVARLAPWSTAMTFIALAAWAATAAALLIASYRSLRSLSFLSAANRAG